MNVPNLEVDVVEGHVEDFAVFKAEESLVAPIGAPGVDELQGAALVDADQSDSMAALVFLTFFVGDVGFQGKQAQIISDD